MLLRANIYLALLCYTLFQDYPFHSTTVGGPIMMLTLQTAKPKLHEEFANLPRITQGANGATRIESQAAGHQNLTLKTIPMTIEP